ncbi:MAG: PatB family C-S lyase [Pseudomonadales bacterium]|nr:PatB family C-S lyase [Pseudomonadales bacterium]
MIDFDEVIDRNNTGSTKWNKYKGQDILPFWVADMDFKAPEQIQNALHERILHGVYGYSRATPKLIDAFLSWLDDNYQWKVPAEWLVWLPGVVPGFNLACRTAGNRGDSIMMSVPVYYPFLSAPENDERAPIYVNKHFVNDRWEMDFEAMQAQYRDNCKMFLLCNPHNPTGRIYTRKELGQLADFCLERDMLICSDEIHCSILLDQDKPHIPIATLSDEIAQRSITLYSPTKAFNIPGLSCAIAVIPDKRLRKQLINADAGLISGVSPLAFTATETAFTNPGSWIEDLTGYLRGNRDRLSQAVSALPRVKITHAEATYLAWIDIRELDLKDPGAYFESFGLGMSVGKQFMGDGHMRFNFGCPRSTLNEGIKRLEKAILARAESLK